MTVEQDKIILTPAEYLGFEVGEDRKLAGWPEITDYFRMLGELSEKVQTIEIGRARRITRF